MCKFPRKKLLTILLTLGLSQAAVADDIDILSEILPNGSNILFIMDLSGSMTWDLSGVPGSLPAPGQESRVDVLKGAFQDIVNDTDLDNINIGLSVFSGTNPSLPNNFSAGAHGISYPVAPIQGIPAQTILSSNGSFTHPGTSYMPSAGTQNTREYLTSISELWVPTSGTFIVDALYEATLYFRGENVDIGRFFPDDIHAAHPATYTGSLSSVPGSCTTVTQSLTRDDPTGGANCVTNTVNRVMCAEGETSCGLETNCTSQAITPTTRICDSSFTTISQCTTANPSYHSCTKEPTITCSTNVEGQTTCSETGSQIICKENRRRYFCDATAITNYTCDFDIEQCNPARAVGTITYKSPIDTECASNGIILLTDGMPTAITSKTQIQNLIGTTTCAMNDYNSDGQDDFSGWDPGAGQCGIELADFMNNTDHNTSIRGNQTISLYTIGLSLGAGSASAYLYDLATHGGGSFMTASNRAQLTAAFKQAIIGISKRARSFSAPTYTINTSTLLSHSEYVYVPVFNRTASSFWNGNLKKYQLSGGELYGKDMKKATDATGKLLDDVSDLWSATATSVSATESGGAANKLNHASRKVFTDNGSGLVNISTATSTQLGVSDADKIKLINFIRGDNSGGTSRFHMGDIIHSKPVQLMTGSDSEGIVFVGTNEGFLHAFQSSTGNELFAYMPQELLKNIEPQFNNTALETHIYGVDAPITLSDTNNNGIKEAGESASIYFGLRRGGKAYYGLDVTDPENPTLKWKFTHSKLGYTWSQPTVAKLKHSGSNTAEDVLIFGGGYIDDNQLDSTTPDTDTNADRVAAAVFIINANTGSLIKMITGTDLKYAVPSKIKVLDIDRNGSADRLYFSDTGGNVLRVDLDPNKDNRLSDFKLTKLASLGGTSVADQRKFFNEPDVALFKRGGRTIISVSIGSGKRPKPLDTSVNNYFYMLLDENVYNVPSSSQNITPSDLYDAPLASGVNLIAELFNSRGKRGWKIPLDQTGLSGEKALSSSVTFQNKVMFTTFGLKSITTSINNDIICGQSNTNQASLYVLDLLTGKAALDLNDDGTVSDSSDSPIAIGGGGEIPETPQIIRSGFGSSAGGDCTYTDCREIIEIHTGNSPSIAGSGTIELNPIPPSKTLPKVYWVEKDK